MSSSVSSSVSPSMSDGQLVRVESAGPVTTVTLDDPGKRNALSLAMRDQLAKALVEADTDDRCRAVVLTGAGGTFSAGGDLSTMSPDPETARVRLEAIADVIRSVVTCSKPVLAAVDGYAYGAGLSLAAACDIVVAAPDARFCCAFSGVGLTADAGLHWSLPARVGYGRARMLIMLGTVVDADTGHRYGLVDHLAAGASLAAATELAEQLSRRAPRSLAATKSILAEGSSGLDDVLAREAVAQQELLASEDFAEGRAAFFEKRLPAFTGR
jgi:enoyl-CoA hydratase/carnithine racemase